MVNFMNIPNIFNKYISDWEHEVDTVGLSNAGVYLFKDMVLKIQPVSEESDNELQMMQWLRGKINVPNIIEQITDNSYSYILMSRCRGDMCCADQFMKNPLKQAEILANTLFQLWDIPVDGCPCSWPLEKRLKEAAKNVESNNIDIAHTEPTTFGKNGFKNHEELLKWLIDNKPKETKVITHGDFCLPNIFADDSGLTGLIDLGRAGVADKWQDIAICYRSLSNNYSGKYNGIKYSGYQNEMLFNALGIDPDWEIIRYYILLDELF